MAPRQAGFPVTGPFSARKNDPDENGDERVPSGPSSAHLPAGTGPSPPLAENPGTASPGHPRSVGNPPACPGPPVSPHRRIPAGYAASGRSAENNDRSVADCFSG